MDHWTKSLLYELARTLTIAVLVVALFVFPIASYGAWTMAPTAQSTVTDVEFSKDDHRAYATVTMKNVDNETGKICANVGFTGDDYHKGLVCAPGVPSGESVTVTESYNPPGKAKHLYEFHDAEAWAVPERPENWSLLWKYQ